MGYAEFPNIDGRELDYQELIGLYRETKDKYNGTLEKITALENRLSKYERDVDSRIAGAVEASMQQYKGIVDSRIEERFSKIDADLKSQLIEQRNLLLEMNKILTDRVDNDINAFKDEMRNTFINYSSSINATVESMDRALEDMIESIDAWQNDFANVIQGEINKIKETLPQDIESIKYLWNNVLKHGGMSAREWYHYPTFTAEDWNKSNISAQDWYTNARRKLHWDEQLRKMFSPVSGDFTSVERIVEELCVALKVNALTVEEYDSMKITADKYDCSYTTAGEFDWAGLIHRLFDSRTERSE